MFINNTIRSLGLQGGDLFLWLGIEAVDHVDWSYIRTSGAKAVYYQSEPRTYCQFSRDVVDEMWDFSWFNINNCMTDPMAPVLRYVPLGVYQEPQVSLPMEDTSLMFFGDPRFRPCWPALKTIFGDFLVSNYSIWDRNSFADMLASHSIFLNIHKGCSLDLADQRDVPAPVTWRVPKLLNAGRLLVSAHCDPMDEVEFEGMVTFTDMMNLPEELSKIRNMTYQQRKELAHFRHALFAQRFIPGRLFERANIFALLDSVRAVSFQGHATRVAPKP